MKAYFGEPRSPWPRGGKENASGLLHQRFPRGNGFERLHARAARCRGRWDQCSSEKGAGWPHAALYARCLQQL